MTQVHRTTDQFFVFFIHSRWFAKCGFVRLVKGDEFIARCLAERPTQEHSQPQQQAGSQQQQVRDKVQFLTEIRNIKHTLTAKKVNCFPDINP